MRPRHAWTTLGFALLLALRPATASAHPEAPLALPVAATVDASTDYDISVRGERAPRTMAASATSISGDDVRMRARGTTYDFLRLVPNLVVGLHEGGGKAPQYMLRGVDADHGADLAVYVEGIPINEVSHVHGLGYLDIHFLIPELVQRIDVRKGAYAAEEGSFATAGSLRMTLQKERPQNEIGWSQGSFGTQRGLGIVSGRFGETTALAAFEVQGTDGFTVAGDSRRLNVQTRLTTPLGHGSLDLLALAYAGSWHAPGLLPEREVLAGRIDRLGAFNPTDGGVSQLALIGLTATVPQGDDVWRTQVYLQRRSLELLHDFTGFMYDPIHGDQFAQDEQRTTVGGESSYRATRTLWGRAVQAKIGIQERTDFIEPELWHTTLGVKRALWYRDTIAQTTASAYGQGQVDLPARLTLQAGARYDATVFDVQALADGNGSPGAQASGHKQAGIASPKLGLAFRVTDDITVFLNAGSGFRTPDARAAVTPGFSGISRTTGAEVGARSYWLQRRVQLAATVWWMDSDHDVQFAADTGANVEVGPARRMGGELELRTALTTWLSADLDASYTFAHTRGTGRVLPRAPRFLLSAGATARHAATGLFADLHGRHVGSFALDEGGAHMSQPYTVLDAVAGWQGRWLALTLQAQNLLDAQWRDSEYFYASVVDPKRESQPAGDVHFRPGEPRMVLAVGRVLF